MRFLARALQLIGLLEVAYGLSLGLFESDIRRELWYSAIGGGIFFVGWLLQKRLGGR